MQIYNGLFLCLLTPLLLSISSLNAQKGSTFKQDSTQAALYHYKANYLYLNVDTCFFYCQKALPLLKKTKQWNKYLDVLCFLNYCYDTQGDYEALRANNEFAYQEAKKFLGERKINKSQEGYQCALNNFAIIQNRLDNNPHKALNNFLLLHPLLSSKNRAGLAAVEENIADCYQQMGEGKKAISYYKESIEDWQNVRIDGKILIPYIRLSRAYDKLASTYAENLEADSAKYYQLQSIKALEKEEYYDPNLGIRNQLRSIKRSIDFNEFTKANQLIEEVSKTNLTDYQNYQIYYYKGLIELKSTQYRSALDHFDAAISYIKSSGINLGRAAIFQNISQCYLKQNRPKLAKNYLDSTRQYLIFEQSNSYPSLDILHLNLLESDILYELYERTDSIQYLEKKLSVNTLTNNVLSDILRHYETQESKLKLLSDFRNKYEQSIHSLYKLSDDAKTNDFFDKVFFLFEKTKSFLLSEELKEKKIASQSTIIKQQKDISKSFIDDISNYKDQIKDEALSLKERNSLKDQILSTKIKLASANIEIQKLIKKEDKFQVEDISLSQVQSILSPHQLLLEYFVGEENIFLLKIGAKEEEIIKIPNDFELDSTIKSLFSQMKMKQKKGVEKYDTTAFNLYHKLLPINDLNNYKELIIIPDGILENLPFDILVSSISENNSPKELHYLLHDFTISYAYSAAILLEQMSKHPSKTAKILGIFPRFEGTPKELQSSNNIAKYLNKYKGRILEDDKANKNSILELASLFDILHFSTHARGADKEHYNEPSIDLFDGALALSYLRNSDLQVHLAVLSACETNTGEYKKGEGSMSLSRGFSYAGIPSVITSVDSVIEKSTATIIQDFYDLLEDGLPKHEALRQAKINYLQNENLPLPEATPYNWGTFLAIGNMEPIKVVRKSRYYYILFLLTILGGGFFLMKRSRKRLMS